MEEFLIITTFVLVGVLAFAVIGFVVWLIVDNTQLFRCRMKSSDRRMVRIKNFMKCYAFDLRDCKNNSSRYPQDYFDYLTSEPYLCHFIETYEKANGKI